jgi:hypothetical protein
VSLNVELVPVHCRRDDRRKEVTNMKILWDIAGVVLLCGAILAPGGASAVDRATAETPSVSVTLTPLEARIGPGQPLEADLTFLNTGSESVPLNLGRDGLEAVSIQLRNPDGGLTLARELEPVYGLSQVVRADLAPSRPWVHRILISRWVATPLADGHYTVVATVKISPATSISAQAAVEVQASLEPVTRGLMKQWQGTVESDRQPLEARYHALMMLTHTSARGIPPILAALAQSARIDQSMRLQAIDGLGRLDSQAAVEALAQLALRDGGDPRIKNEAAGEIAELGKRSKDPAVVEASRQFVAAHGKTARTKPID